MVEIKICGITNLQDACLSIDCGADAVGFIFYRKSLRYVAPERVKQIVQKLPSGIAKVGVFVNQRVEEVRAISRFCCLDLIQLHGDEPSQYCRQFAPSSVIKAIFCEKDIRSMEDDSIKAFLVDARGNGLYGGTGKHADWELARRMKKMRPLILAGGLNKENVVKAINAVKPRAVDINSGAEISPGKKDPDKVREIVRTVREMKLEGSGNDKDIFSKVRE